MSGQQTITTEWSGISKWARANGLGDLSQKANRQEALAIVNGKREALGLPPFILRSATIGAEGAART